MGYIAEKLGKKAREKVTQLYNASIRKRNEMVRAHQESKQREAELNKRLKKVKREAYEKERYKQAIAEGKRQAKGGGSGLGGTLTTIGKGLGGTADAFAEDFFKMPKQSTRKSSGGRGGTTIRVGNTVISVSKRKKRKKKETVEDYLL